jgi:Transglycosylase
MKTAITLLAVVLTSPIWGFELAYRQFLPPVLPELPATSEASRFELDALWIEAGEQPSTQVEPAWAFNFFRSPRYHRPAGAYAAERIARLWVSKVSPGARHVRWSLAVMATSIWLSRNASAEELKRGLAEWTYFGRRAYGIKAAREVWFGCGASLTIAQETLLLGLPQSPAENHPIRHPDRALARRLHILKSLVAASLVSSDEEAEAEAEDAEATVLPAAPDCP